MATMAPATNIPGPSKDDKTRQAGQAMAWQSYRGEFAEPLQKSPDDPVEQPNFNVMPNMCRGIVDTGKDFLIGNEPITLEVTDGDSDDSDYDLPKPGAQKGKPSPAQQCLDSAWGDKDDMMTFFSKLVLSGGVAGQAVVKVIPPKVVQKGAYARMVLLDPQTVSVCTDPDDYEKVLTYIIQYPIYNEDGGISTYKRQVIQLQDDGMSWAIGNYMGPTDQAMEQQGPIIPWADPSGKPYPFAPIQSCQNLPNPHVWWGLSDLSPDIIGINNAIILIASCINKIAWYHGNPLKWTDAGFPGGSIAIDPARILTLGTLGAKLEAVAAHGDIAGLMAFIDSLLADLDEMSGIPAVALGRLKDLRMGALSGVAQEMLYSRIIAKTTTKRRLYGWLISKLCQIHLCFGGYDDTADSSKIKVTWPQMLPRDAFQEWQSAMFQEQLGVSGHTIFSNFGLDWDHEQDMLQQESAKKQQGFNAGTGMAPQAQQLGQKPTPQSPAFIAQQQKMQQVAGVTASEDKESGANG